MGLILQGMAALFIVAQSGDAPAPGRPLDMEEQVIITNYWQYINKLLDSRRNDPAYDLKKTQHRYPNLREFPFEAFRHLRARDLLRGAQEGIIIAERSRKSPEEVARIAEANVGLCLEYYPLLAEGLEDLDLLFYEMEDAGAEKPLRLYLFKHCVPGFVPNSIFRQYMDDTTTRHEGRFDDVIRNVLTRTGEDDDVLMLAIRAARRRYLGQLERVLLAAEGLPEWAAERNIPLGPQVLQADEGPELNYVTKKDISSVENRVRDFAGLLHKQGDGGFPRSPEVMEAVQETLAKLEQEFPVAVAYAL